MRVMTRAKVCAEPGCPEIGPERLCAAHRRAREVKRGSRQARGYGAAHEALRRRYAPFVARGKVTCWRCGLKIEPTEPWDLGHDDDDRARYTGPEHVRCNRATASRL